MAVTGRKDELDAFVQTVNSLPSLPEFHPNGFGPWWLGNLVHALGGDWEKIPCRGVINPEPNAGISWSCAEPGLNWSVSLDEKDVARFSLTMAWGLDTRLLDFINEKWPSLEFAWKATDEFGNFYERHDPDGLLDGDTYEFDAPDACKSYEDKEKFLADLREFSGLDLKAEDSDSAILDRFGEWLESLPEDDVRRWAVVRVWTDV